MNILTTSPAPKLGSKMVFGKEQVHLVLADQVNLDRQRTIGEVCQQIVDITEIVENICLPRIKVGISHTLPTCSANPNLYFKKIF